MHFYIAGPMRGIPNRNKESFDFVEKQLIELGHTACNPHNGDRLRGWDKLPDEAFSDRHMMNAVKRVIDSELETCDAMILLPGCHCSRGACYEERAADFLGMPIFLTNGMRWQPCVYPKRIRRTSLKTCTTLQPKRFQYHPDFKNWLKTQENTQDCLNQWSQGIASALEYVRMEASTEADQGTDAPMDGSELEDTAVLDVPQNSCDDNQSVEAGGAKYDAGKAAFDLIPVETWWELAELYATGCTKYLPRNWEEGFRWGRAYAAAQRHLNAWWRGEDRCPENHQHHLIAAIWNIIALREFQRRRIGENDRPKPTIAAGREAV